MSQLLNERWSETKDALLEGLQGNRRSSMGVCLENTRKYLAKAQQQVQHPLVTLQHLTVLFFLLSVVLCQQ